jgi:glutathionylspermidine amidase/synthetase
MTHHHSARSAPFGALLGIGPGNVPVYSSDYATADPAELPTRQHYRSHVDGIYMGHKWQCVELARRWMYLNKGYIFDDIAMAYDIFRLSHVRVVKDNSLLPLKSFRNGSKRPPEPGCLLIWNEGGEFDVTGHVAVVTEVFPEKLRCIEQNVEHEIWPEGQDWARELRITSGADGGHWVDCTYEDTSILGWVIQTGDATHAETITDPDPRLYNLQRRSVPRAGQADVVWLDPKDQNQAAYIDMMGGCRLTNDPGDQYEYYCISETARRELRRATNELHRMFLHATNYVLENDDRLRKFNIPEVLWPRIHQSWNNRRTQMITGRFDFTLSERGLKVYEYNADSASCHMECGFVQDRWAAHFGCDVGRSSGRNLFTELVEAWEESGVDDVLHIMHDRDKEEIYHALYMKSAIEKAGIRCKLVKGVKSLTWDDEGWVCDADGVRIKWVWKTWSWETALDQLRADLAEDEENKRLNRPVDRCACPPRLVDVLLREEVMVFEPLWTLIPSNKAILPVMTQMYPTNRYLLDSHYELADSLKRTGYVVKPIVGRCGANISIFNRDNDLIGETSGKFDDRDQIYQQLFRLPKIDGANVQIGTFSVGGTYGGACVRVDPSPIITTNSDLLPLRVVPDEAFLAGYDEAVME